MTARIHVAAAAKQLNRKLFNDKPVEGSVMVASNDNLEVVVFGDWTDAMLKSYAGYQVVWREVSAA